MDTLIVILVIAAGCAIVGLPFTWIYWKQADKWAETERRRMEAQRRAADASETKPEGSDTQS